jgi:hypothetical protein
LQEHNYRFAITWPVALDEDVASIITNTTGYSKQTDSAGGNELPMGDCPEVRLYLGRGVAPLQENKMNYKSTSLRRRRGVAGTSGP